MSAHISVSHDLDVALRDEIAAANLASLLAREKAREAPRNTEKIIPRSTSSSNAEEVDHVKPPAKKPAAKPTKAKPAVAKRPAQPSVPPGHLLLSPREVEAMQHLIDTHPAMRGQR